MKTRIFKFAISIIKKVGLILILGAFVSSCVEDIGDSYTTFKGDMIYSFLKKKPELYSEYIAIVDKAGLSGMLNAYGTYTCLAPTNDAFKLYYKSFGPNFNIDSLSNEQIDYLAKTHIVDNQYITDELQDGVLPNPNMNKRLISIKFTSDSITNAYKIVLNDSSQIISRDNKVYNGVVQGINRVLRPSEAQLPELIKNNPDLSIFSAALKLTGLNDSLLLTTDVNYKPTKVFKDEYNGYEIINPKEKKYGYTALIESNTVLSRYGINNLTDLINKANELYPNSSAAGNYTSRENSLNKYISYHLVNKAIYLNKFFYATDAVKGFTPDEFIETMYPNHIIRTSKNKVTNRITLNANSTNVVQVEEIGGQTTVNGVFHLLDNMLIYTQSVEEMLQNTRMRFDIVSLFPEFANNNLRGSRGFMKVNNSSGDRFGFEDGYLKDVTISKDTRLIYLAGKDKQWANFQSDELMALGTYDITVRLLPVPPGTYELRFGYSANSARSVTQVYIDNKPIGIPLDLRTPANDPKIGWLLDTATDDNGVENDKMMRNRGYMKGPNTYYYSETIVRNYNGSLRRIIGTFTFTEYSAHILRFKSVIDNPQSQCMMDYFEYVPKSVFNPADGTPEGRE